MQVCNVLYPDEIYRQIYNNENDEMTYLVSYCNHSYSNLTNHISHIPYPVLFTEEFGISSPESTLKQYASSQAVNQKHAVELFQLTCLLLALFFFPVFFSWVGFSTNFLTEGIAGGPVTAWKTSVPSPVVIEAPDGTISYSRVTAGLQQLCM